jgi:transglutaminase-like putative cysteine protease
MNGRTMTPSITSTGASFPLKSALNFAVAIFAILVFFMGRELIGTLYAWGFLALLALAFLVDHSELPHPPRILINLATLAALGAIFARVRFNFLIEALMESLLLMIAVKMLEDKRPRDYVQIVLLGLASLVCYAMLSLEKDFIVYCFGMGLTSTLILLLSTWLDKDPGAFVSARELRQLFTRTGAIFAVMLPLCLTLFFGLPRVNSPFFGTRGRYGTVSTGFSDQVQLGDVASIQSNNKLAFRAEMAPLDDKEPYWRGMVLDIFEGRVWLSSRNTAGRGDFIPEVGAPHVEQEIVLEAGNRGVLFALDQPLTVLGPDIVSDGDGAFRYRSRNVGRRLQYQAVSVLSSRMRPAFAVDRRRYMTLPGDFIPRLRALVEDMTSGMNDREKVTAVAGFLASPEFSYSLEGLSSTGNALEQFIFVTKAGNCEYFAAAMGVMLRMAGVPARLVAGYRGGVYNEAGGYYMVQEQNAHVWVEAWDLETGVWVRHDPTPVGAGPSGGLSTYDTFGMYLDLLDYQWSKLVNYNWETQMDLAQNLRDVLRNPRASLPPTRDGFRRLGAALSLPATILAALTGCVALFAFVRALRKRRPEIILLKDFSRAMRRNGYRRHESEGLSEFLERVDDAKLRALALPFVRSFEGCYYRDRPMNSELLQSMKQRIRKISQSRKAARNI